MRKAFYIKQINVCRGHGRSSQKVHKMFTVTGKKYTDFGETFTFGREVWDYGDSDTVRE